MEAAVVAEAAVVPVKVAGEVKEAAAVAPVKVAEEVKEAAAAAPVKVAGEAKEAAAVAPVKVAGEAKEAAAGAPVKVAGEVKEAAAPGNAAVAPPPRERNRIQVASNKKPVRFYVSLAKRLMRQHNEVVLSALGKAIGTVVKIAVILKTTGLATEKCILTSTVELMDESSGRNIQKPKIEILLGKTDKLNDLKGVAVRVDDDGGEPEDHKDC